MKKLIRTVAVLAAGTVALSCASCGLVLGGAKTEEIVDAADDFAAALTTCDAGKIIKLTNEKKSSSTAEELSELLDTSSLSKDSLLFVDAVADTLEYEIDEDSVKIDKDEASVDVTFTMVDYEDALAGDTYNSIDEALKILDSSKKTKEVQVTFEFVSDDGDWLISNIGDKDYKKLFDFYGFTPEIMPDLASLVQYTDIYTGFGYIEMMVAFEEDVSEYLDLMTCTISCDGQTFQPDDAVTGYGNYVYCGYYVDGEVPAGYYTVYLKIGDSTVASDSITVEDESEVDPFGGSYVFGELEGDTYVTVFDYTDSFSNNYLYMEGYDVEMEGNLQTTMYLKLGDGMYELWIDEDEFKENMYDYLYANSDELMADFLGCDKDEVEEYAASLGFDDYQFLEDSLIESLVLGYIGSSDSWDYGTYTVSGDKITFESVSMDDFTASYNDDGSITLDIDFLDIVFYPEG